MEKRQPRISRPRLQLDLALQGGGALGAFTWGVLDRLLEEEHIDIGRISGTSAGALNGAVLATGLARGGRKAAQEHLASLWNQVALAGSIMTFLMLPLRKPGSLGLWDDLHPLISPYQANPLGMAPLRAILDGVVDVELLRQDGAAPRVHVNAVHVQTGKGRVFGPAELSLDAILASACAPLVYQAVRIEGEDYWDGSYVANPYLWPLYEGRHDTDILLVELIPPHRAETPMSAKNILNRINEITSINGLVAELAALQTVNRHAPGADIRLHAVSMPAQPAAPLGKEPSVKRTVDRNLFEMLRQDGRRACEAWLAEHGTKLGRQSSIDVDAHYLRPYAQPGVGGAAQMACGGLQT
ncbi:patatin-like phospholipase family protein [Comamonas endophytica]|uniref:Patatin-like phospholipase family protein n=1 Tax=Comamonas endophytica TaxID=2949090 RepID=A0ABY6GET2_9BURK|nr:MULTISPECIES: patatin-like phospholipase family protein [unclassified Acidovorax]MCD2513237.1 patatin-like phospholipase family protein [Acidovorax sp. D4N7]UYG53418.1 patatin-like phospholipase family protein [Acidovorax sp. 5MLIR]